MRVTYVLPQPELGGGNKVAAQHAAMLADAGVDVTMIAEGPRPAWLPFAGRYVDRSSGSVRLGSQDVLIATFWTTIETATKLELGPVAHFCQGYEGGLVHLRAMLPQIEAAYSTPRPTLTVTPALGEFVARRFGREFRVTPPVLDPGFRKRARWAPRRRPWIAVCGVFEAEVKDIATALRAVVRLRATGRQCRVFRCSTLPLSDVERAILEPDRYLHAVAPSEVARQLRDCDLLLFSSLAGEGFGLPLLEAMASGVPAVSSRIPSTVFMTDGAVRLVEPGDDEAFARAAEELLDRPSRWRHARAVAHAAAQRFDRTRILPDLIAAVRWAADAP